MGRKRLVAFDAEDPEDYIAVSDTITQVHSIKPSFNSLNIVS